MRATIRKALIATTGLVAVTAALAGCAAGDDGTGQTAGATTGESSTAGSSASGAFPQTIDTAFGEVTIDEEPERIVALGWGDAEVAIAFGVQPVGASDWLAFGGDGLGPWVEEGYTTTPEIIGTLDPSYEQIAALEPDLILDVKSSGDQDRYERLTQIATTVGVPEGAESYLTSTEQQVTIIGQALGQPERAAELLADIDDAYAQAASDHPQWQGKTATVATRTSEGWGAYVDGDTRLESLKQLGFEQNPSVAALPVSESGFSVAISDEQLSVFEADVIVAFPILSMPPRSPRTRCGSGSKPSRTAGRS